MRLLRVCAGAALLLWLGMEPAGAGDFRLLRLGNSIVKWGQPQFGTGAVITYAFATRPRHFDTARNCRALDPFHVISRASGIAMPTLALEFEQALASWERVANVRFRHVEDGATANILVGAQAEPRGYAFANVVPAGAGAAERATTGPADTASPAERSSPGPHAREPSRIVPIEQSVICLNPNRPWKVGFDGNTEVYDLRYTFAHEIGHALGLDHPGASGELMSFRYGEEFRSPQHGDGEGAAMLYGRMPRVD